MDYFGEISLSIRSTPPVTLTRAISCCHCCGPKSWNLFLTNHRTLNTSVSPSLCLWRVTWPIRHLHTRTSPGKYGIYRDSQGSTFYCSLHSAWLNSWIHRSHWLHDHRWDRTWSRPELSEFAHPGHSNWWPRSSRPAACSSTSYWSRSTAGCTKI